ncbi:MAG: stress-responsive transcription factor hsf1 [Bogoriella megaspora]|nr:MAG: stress-responsive transcription factor hsf1 [Bogoriella megaspora]
MQSRSQSHSQSQTQFQTQSRKRPAPGTIPYQNSTNPTPDTSLPFTTNDNLMDTTNQQSSSNQLVRRTTNQQMALRDQQFQDDGWLEYANPQTQSGNWEEGTDEEDLERKAVVAKKEAQAKRKTIPPFVQKLSSFLDESSNTDLIRWSDDGNSFIVLDEDEFAKTLIPELFKHNKYASFVRQLNMYGFHKKVGLSDNSMRASEKKAKNPSEFYNPYFKRGRPELLWLIHKPKNGPSNPKRKRDDGKEKNQDESSDDDKKLARGSENQLGSIASTGTQELTTLPQSELSTLRQELQALQRQQRFISKVITQVREQNHQLYQQAQAFQALHDRHENSISAILTFLATFYNRNVEGLSGQNLANMFASAIPQNTQQHGTVEDMGDYRESDVEAPNQLRKPSRKPLALLPAPTTTSTTTSTPTTFTQPTSTPISTRITTESPNPLTSTTSQQTNRQSSNQNVQRPGGARTRKSLQESTSNDTSDQTSRPDTSTRDIMNLIKDANASAAASPSNNQSYSGTSFDFPAALSHYQSANGNAPLTSQERDNMLALMANGQSENDGATLSNNALTSPTPPPMPSLDNFAASQQQLDMLQRLQQEQDAKVQNLADRLQPLSPSGSIPGLHNGGSGDSAAPPSELDLNNFIDSGDYFTGQGQGDGTDNLGNTLPDNLFEAPDFGIDFSAPDDSGLGTTDDFNFGPTNDADSSGIDNMNWTDEFQGGATLGNDLDGQGRIVESVSSEATSPAGTGVGMGDDVEGEKIQTNQGIQSPSKRRRVV